MSNEYFAVTGTPGSHSQGASSAVRGEFTLIQAAFDKLPVLAGNGDKAVFINAAGTAVVAVTAATARTNLGLVIGTNVQAYDATLTSIALLGTAADKIAYTTGVDTWAETALTSFGRSLIDDAASSNARTTLGVVIGTDVQAYNANLAAIAGLTSAANKGITFTGSGTAAVYDLSAAALTILDDASVSAMVDTLGGASATGTGGLVRATSPTITTSIVAGGTSFALVNTVATTVNFAGAASVALNIGHASGTNTILGATTFSQAITASSTVNKVTITAPASSATLTLANTSSLITVGAFSTTLTATGTTTLTMPTSGTLAVLTDIPSSSLQSKAENDLILRLFSLAVEKIQSRQSYVQY